MRVLRPSLLSIGLAFVACGAPSSFDGLTGGPPIDAGVEPEVATPPVLVPDDSLPAPRPLAPISVSWVSSSRPRLRWELAQGTTGARVELCRTRACDAEKKTFEAAGPELTVPEDLAPGIWFWRLYGKTAFAFGTKPSATWEMLVRGGPVADKTNVANGSILDIDGDGRADLLVTLEYVVGAETFLDVVPLLAKNEDGAAFATEDEQGFPPRSVQLRTNETSLAGGIDTDGDGFADFLFVDKATATTRGVYVVPGSAMGAAADRSSVVPTPTIEELPVIEEGGDIDGDGFGDMLVSTRGETLGFFGTGRGFGPFQYMIQVFGSADGGAPPFSAPIPAGGAVDRNGDGFSDVAVAMPFGAPLFFVLGGAGRELGGYDPTVEAQPVRGPAERFASGDFDGDGLVDTAFSTTQDGKPAVCVLRATEPQAAKLSCFAPAAAPPGFSTSIIACDLEGDGRDEILVGSTSSGVDVLRLTDSTLTAEHLSTEWGARITTVYPGRPGPAVWAATRSDGSSVAVFKGATRATTIAPFAQAARFGAWIR